MNNDPGEATAQATTLLLEEYKVLVDQSRFVMTRYMQAIAIYMALIGFSLKEVVAVNKPHIMFVLLTIIFCLNFVAYYAAIHFRRMAYHALDKQTEVANKLSFQPPYPMAWGFYAGIVLVTLVQIAIIFIVVSA